MKNFIKHLFMLCLFGMISMGARAEEIPNNQIWYEASAQLKETTSTYSYGLHTNAFNTTIKSHSFSEGKGIITFDTDVTSIGMHAFYYSSGLTSVTIPNSVTEIGDWAFRDCSGLTSVSIGNSVTSIGEYAFCDCSGLTSVTIPNSVTSIGGNAFWGCTGLTSVTIGNSVTSIGEYAFDSCSGLTSVTIPNSVTEIESYAFWRCSGLTSVTIGNSVTKIGDHAFNRCNNVKELIYAEGTKTVLSTYLTSITSVTIPNSVISIGDDAFSGCSGLTSVTIPNSVTSIGSYAFWNCSGLASVTIPNSVTSIGDYAFYECSGLTSVTIPNSVTSIGESAFDGCTSLPVEDNLRYADTYLVGAVNKNLSTYNIKEGTKWIGDYAFYRCSGLTSVTIPNSVTSIVDNAFYMCSAMRSVYVGWDKESDIPSIESNTFPYSRCTLYVPQGAAELYLAKEYWKKFKSIAGGLIIEDKDGNKTSIYIADSNPSFTLSDDINSINNSGIIRDVTITYTRNFEKAGVWQAWYMPFDVDFDDMKEAYDVAQIHGVLLDKDNNAVIAFLKLDDGTVKANTPYVVRPKKSGEVVIKPKTNLQIHPTSFYMMSATHKYTIGGVFEKTTTSGNWYALNLDGQFQLMGSGVYLRPFRIYMTIDPRIDNPYAQSASTTAKMDIVVIGDGETTGIKESLTPALSEGKGAIYNLSGLRVNSIQKGQIYIMNGKKYIAK